MTGWSPATRCKTPKGMTSYMPGFVDREVLRLPATVAYSSSDVKRSK